MADAARAAVDGGLDLAAYLPSEAYRLAIRHPRIRPGHPSSAVLARARYRIDVLDSAGFDPDLLRRVLARLQDTGTGRVEVRARDEVTLRVTRTAAARRARRWHPDLPRTDLVDALFGSEPGVPQHRSPRPAGV